MRKLIASPDAVIAQQLFALSPERPLAVAISGGSDSLALLHLLHSASRSAEPQLALTVDHRLRPESRAEADAVAKTCGALGIAHKSLRWEEGPAKTGNLSEQARMARYRLMAEACRVAGIGTLLTAHTLDDQAETVMMRVMRGSGVDGLAGIPERTRLFGVEICRPLLGVRREILRDWLRARGIDWIDDPSNDDPAYDRVRVRQTIAALDLDVGRLARMATMMRNARQVLEEAADRLFDRAGRYSTLGVAELDLAALLRAPTETALRLLSRLLCQVSGNPRRPRLDSLEAALRRLADEGDPAMTLHGAILRAGESKLRILPEPARRGGAISLRCGGTIVWDNRFEITIPNSIDLNSGIEIGALGEAGLRQVAAAIPSPPTEWTDAPREARLCAPALRKGETLLGVPLARLHLDPLSEHCYIAFRYATTPKLNDPERPAG